MNQLPSAFWSLSAIEILQHLGTAKEGLSSEEARQQLTRYGSNLLKPQKRSDQKNVPEMFQLQVTNRSAR
jgi:hypothetical protein